MIVALIGPSAAGKSSLAARLVAGGDAQVVRTVTTRPARLDESAGSLDHEFCDDADFETMLVGGGFSATGGLPGLEYRYGLPRFRADRRPRLVLARPEHVAGLKGLGSATVVYQVEASAHECGSRLGHRGTPADEATLRLACHRVDLDRGRRCADRVFGNDGSLDDLAEHVAAALFHDVKELAR